MDPLAAQAGHHKRLFVTVVACRAAMMLSRSEDCHRLIEAAAWLVLQTRDHETELELPTLTHMEDRIPRTVPDRAIWILDAQQQCTGIPFEARDREDNLTVLVSHQLKALRERNSSLRRPP